MLPSESISSAGMKQTVGRDSIPNNWDNWGRCPLTQGTQGIGPDDVFRSLPNPYNSVILCDSTINAL